MAITAKDKVRQVEPGIWKLVDGRFYVDIRPAGKEGKKVRATKPKLEEAREFKRDAFAKASMGEAYKPVAKDKRRLSELVEQWHDLYGHSLKDKERKLQLLAICKGLGDPIAQTFTAEDFMIYRKSRLDTVQPGKGGKTISANTVNHAHAYLSSVFNRLKQLGKWDYPNPLAGIPKLSIDEAALTFLDKIQIRLLLGELEHSQNKDLLIITKICLSIGSRWSEAANLEVQNVRAGKIHLSNTKNGRSRSIPISPELEREILEGRPKHGKLFNTADPKKGFSNALKRAGIHLPDGQLTHVLRHTFASHFMMNDGNILKLMHILDHSSLDMTLRYAKLAPDHLTQAVTHNPLATLSEKFA